jgi:hypothetical protein
MCNGPENMRKTRMLRKFGRLFGYVIGVGTQAANRDDSDYLDFPGAIESRWGHHPKYQGKAAVRAALGKSSPDPGESSRGT